jgi:hypothetical protein
MLEARVESENLEVDECEKARSSKFLNCQFIVIADDAVRPFTTVSS